jgi:hypothetical protein
MVLAQKQTQTPMEQNRDMNPHSYAHLIFTKSPKTYNGE